MRLGVRRGFWMATVRAQGMVADPIASIGGTKHDW